MCHWMLTRLKVPNEGQLPSVTAWILLSFPLSLSPRAEFTLQGCVALLWNFLLSRAAAQGPCCIC